MIKTNLFSIIAGVVAPSASIYTLVRRQAVGMGFDADASKRIASMAFANYRNSGLFSRYGELATLTAQQLQGTVVVLAKKARIQLPHGVGMDLEAFAPAPVKRQKASKATRAPRSSKTGKAVRKNALSKAA